MDTNQDHTNAKADISNETLLFKAIKKNDLIAVQKHIEAGVDLDKIHPKTRSTPLMYAAQYSNPLIIKALINAGADINKANAAGETPLMISAMHGNELTPFLSTPGIEVNAKDSRGSTALMHAIKKFNCEAAKELIACPGIDVNAKDTNGKTALMLCAEKDSPRNMEHLLAHPSIDVNAQDINGYTALMLSARRSIVTGKNLLAHPRININIKGPHALGSALIIAACYDNHIMLMNLIEAGADLTERDRAGDLALMSTQTDLAAFTIINALSPEKMSIHAKIMGPPFHSLLEKYKATMLVLKEKTFETIWAIDQCTSQSTLKDDALIKKTIIENQSPPWCSIKQYDQIYQAEKNKVVIIRKKIELNRQLIDAIKKEDAPRVTDLLTAGANPNVIVQKGVTALILASQHKCHEVIKALLDAGAKVNDKDKEDTSKPLAQNTSPVSNPLISDASKNSDQIKLKNNVQKKTFSIKNLYSKFKKHPSYYIFSGATRLAIGALVGYGISYGLTALAAPFLAPVIEPILPSLANNVWTLTALLPKAIAAVSMLGGALASIKLSNTLLSYFFGELKIKVTVASEGDKSEKEILDMKKVKGILEIFGQHRPYVTSVSEIVDQLEQQLRAKNKDNADLLPQSKTFALAFAKKLVEKPENAHLFDSAAKAEVNTEPYVSAAAKLT
jgi:ankyrin repeat protein